MLFLNSPDGAHAIRSVGDFFSDVDFHIAAFLFAWPQTFSKMFDHWFYLPELLIGLFLLYYLIKTVDDSDFYREDGIKCFAPYLLIEGIRALFLNSYIFTKLACILRAFGLGTGLCILVWIARKIFVRKWPKQSPSESRSADPGMRKPYGIKSKKRSILTTLTTKL